MAKRDRCSRIKRSDADVIWDDPSQSRGNRQKVWAHLKRDRNVMDEIIAERYSSKPSPRALFQSGQIGREATERAERVRALGPPERPFRELIAALRSERERQGLSLADIAKRTGMDRAAIHKLEIGLNSNPTHATLTRYAMLWGPGSNGILRRFRRNRLAHEPLRDRLWTEINPTHAGADAVGLGLPGPRGESVRIRRLLGYPAVQYGHRPVFW